MFLKKKIHENTCQKAGYEQLEKGSFNLVEAGILHGANLHNVYDKTKNWWKLNTGGEF